MTEAERLRDTVRAFADLDDADSVPLLLNLMTWRADLDRRLADQATEAIALAARFDALIAAQDKYFADRHEYDRREAGLDAESRDYATSFESLQGQLLGAAMRYRDRTAVDDTNDAVTDAAFGIDD